MSMGIILDLRSYTMDGAMCVFLVYRAVSNITPTTHLILGNNKFMCLHRTGSQLYQCPLIRNKDESQI